MRKKQERTFLMQVIFFSLQGDFGQSHKYCPSDDHPLDFYSYGRTVLVHFKSDAFMAGNGLKITFKIASKFHFPSEPSGVTLHCPEPLGKENKRCSVFIKQCYIQSLCSYSSFK